MAGKLITTKVTKEFEALNKFEVAQVRAELLAMAYECVENKRAWYQKFEYDEDGNGVYMSSDDAKDRDREKIVDKVLEELEGLI